jgi:SAM-dependent methyltransferase
MNTPVGAIHDAVVAGRRARILARGFAELLGDARTVLDVGCGDGSIDLLIQGAIPGLSIRGVDVLVRANTKIPVERFDGRTLPFGDKTFDALIFVDVLHHTDDPRVLLKEAKRVARSAVVLKDHTMEGPLAYQTLRFMDWVGNAQHGVSLSSNYWREQRWHDAFASIGFRVERWRSRLDLYPWPASLLFDRRLHFIARLKP